RRRQDWRISGSWPLNPPSPPLPATDLEHILAHTAPLWRELAGSRLFITGGTGFFGIWLLESIAAANDAMKVGVGATVLSRDPQRFLDKMPHLAVKPYFHWLSGNTEDFIFLSEKFDYIVHFATPSAAQVGSSDAELTMSTLLSMQRVLQFARHSQAKRLLLASSGAVYGSQPGELGRLPETCVGAPDPGNPESAYGEIKRMSELLATLTPEVNTVVARGFSFIGPHLPLTSKFAAGSFMRDALAGGPIRIRGKGKQMRSYLHAADLVVWLLTMLVRGRKGRTYNVGSDVLTSILDLARIIADASEHPIEILLGDEIEDNASSYYVPDTSRARNELGLKVEIDLRAAIVRTFAWLDHKRAVSL
ncbi:MAG: NAD(P)-dependent oxidoreductase, partial [Sulfuritalea sp.]|nr:NAD(P)-dependent oxidoreductase [Sulfuritalea sp.]